MQNATVNEFDYGPGHDWSLMLERFSGLSGDDGKYTWVRIVGPRGGWKAGLRVATDELVSAVETVCHDDDEKVFVAAYEFLDGENEYVYKQFVRAVDINDAMKKVEEHLAGMWGDKTVHEDGAYWRPDGCVAVRASSVCEVTSLEKAIGAIGLL
jgi:hypothetical protein